MDVPDQLRKLAELRACLKTRVGTIPYAFCMRKTYPTDLSDVEWTHVKAYLPAPKPRGKPRIHDQREILDAIFYVLRSGCAWRLMPHDFLPWQTAYYYFRYWKLKGIWHRLLKALHAAERLRAGRSPDPTAAIMDSQSVKTTEESSGSKGYDAHKNVAGRKRHLLVDTMGLQLSVFVTGCREQTFSEAPLLLDPFTNLPCYPNWR